MPIAVSVWTAASRVCGDQLKHTRSHNCRDAHSVNEISQSVKGTTLTTDHTNIRRQLELQALDEYRHLTAAAFAANATPRTCGVEKVDRELVVTCQR